MRRIRAYEEDIRRRRKIPESSMSWLIRDFDTLECKTLGPGHVGYAFGLLFLWTNGILMDIMIDNGQIWCKLSALVMVYIH